MPNIIAESVNPKARLMRQMEEAEGHTAVPPTKAWKAEEAVEGHKGIPFTKKWTTEERAEHQRKLAEMLRKR